AVAGNDRVMEWDEAVGFGMAPQTAPAWVLKAGAKRGLLALGGSCQRARRSRRHRLRRAPPNASTGCRAGPRGGRAGEGGFYSACHSIRAYGAPQEDTGWTTHPP